MCSSNNGPGGSPDTLAASSKGAETSSRLALPVDKKYHPDITMPQPELCVLLAIFWRSELAL